MVALPVYAFLAAVAVEDNQSDYSVRCLVEVIRSAAPGGLWQCCAADGSVWLGNSRGSLSPREFATLDAVWSSLSRALPPGAVLELRVREVQ